MNRFLLVTLMARNGGLIPGVTARKGGSALMVGIVSIVRIAHKGGMCGMLQPTRVAVGPAHRAGAALLGVDLPKNILYASMVNSFTARCANLGVLGTMSWTITGKTASRDSVTTAGGQARPRVRHADTNRSAMDTDSVLVMAIVLKDALLKLENVLEDLYQLDAALGIAVMMMTVMGFCVMDALVASAPRRTGRRRVHLRAICITHNTASPCYSLNQRQLLRTQFNLDVFFGAMSNTTSGRHCLS